jgi:hypothetical protein
VAFVQGAEAETLGHGVNRTAVIAERRTCTGPSYADKHNTRFWQGYSARALNLAVSALVDYRPLPRSFQIALILLHECLKSRIALQGGEMGIPGRTSDCQADVAEVKRGLFGYQTSPKPASGSISQLVAGDIGSEIRDLRHDGHINCGRLFRRVDLGIQCTSAATLEFAACS